MEKTKMYPFCQILYKTEDSPGWLYGIISGDKETAEKKCKKNFTSYQIFDGNKSEKEVEDHYPRKLHSATAHLTTYWIYNEETDRWFLPEETIPCPASPCKDAKKIKFGFDLSDGKRSDDNSLRELLEYYTEEKDIYCNDTVYITACITIKADKKKIRFCINYSGYVYENFIDLVHDLADFSIDKEVFIRSISSLIEYLNNTYKRLDKEVRAAYKLQKKKLK